MRWFIFSLFLICFSLQAQVVCKDPNSAGGDEVAEGRSTPSLCRTNVTDASQGSVDRVNVAKHVNTVDPTQTIKDEEKAPSSVEGNDADSKRGIE